MFCSYFLLIYRNLLISITVSLSLPLSSLLDLLIKLKVLILEKNTQSCVHTTENLEEAQFMFRNGFNLGAWGEMWLSAPTQRFAIVHWACLFYFPQHLMFVKIDKTFFLSLTKVLHFVCLSFSCFVFPQTGSCHAFLTGLVSVI